MLREQGRRGHYMAHNFGTVDPSSHPNENSFLLKFLYDDLHNTLLRIKIDASSVSFVYTVGSGRIVDVETTDFEALVDSGKITVVIENTGEVTASFSVSVLRCTRGVHSVPAKSIYLNPGEVGTLEFTVQAFFATGTDYSCESTYVSMCI